MWPEAKPRVVELVQSLNLHRVRRQCLKTLRFCLEAENVRLTRSTVQPSLLLSVACPVLYVDVQRVEDPHQFQDFTGRVVSSACTVVMHAEQQTRETVA